MRKLDEVIAMAGGIKRFREMTGFSTSRVSSWRVKGYIPKRSKTVIQKNFPLVNEKFWIDRGVVKTVNCIIDFMQSYDDESLLTVVQTIEGNYKVIY